MLHHRPLPTGSIFLKTAAPSRISYLNYVKPKKVSVFVEANTEAEIIDEEREICFELRIKRAKWIRTYADVLVITNDKVFSLEFKMKDKADPEERGKEFD